MFYFAKKKKPASYIHRLFVACYNLRGGYLQIMFIAVVIDEKTQTLPTIFYLGMTNNIDYCIWFLMRLKEALRDAREVSFIINMDNVITSSLGQLFPNFYHVYCCKCLALHLLTIVVETEHLNICSSVHANHILRLILKKHYFG